MTDKRGDTFVMSEGEGQKLDFSSFLLGLASTALIHLGAAPNPESGGVVVDLFAARQTLEVLDLLRAKTRGNLTPEEERFFESLLTDLRLRYVEASK
jgi:hypothetical protein